MNTVSQSSQPWRILVVDDLLVWADTVSRLATFCGCDTRIANNLDAAIQELARWRPHLIILDLHLPQDRWEPVASLGKKYEPHQKSLAFCEQVTSHPKLSKIIVAIVSVEEQVQQQELAYKAGAHYFYNKSNFGVNELENLLMRVNTLNSTT